MLVGSPRAQGRSATLAAELAAQLQAQGAQATTWPLATRPVAACTGCGACSKTGECCLQDAAWRELEPQLAGTDLLFVVAPLYFAGPTAQLAALLGRCQVFWARRYVLGRPLPPARPAHLLVVGEGGDPFGSEPLQTICTSALNSVNLRITAQRTHSFVGADYDVGRAAGIARAALAELAPTGSSTAPAPTSAAGPAPETAAAPAAAQSTPALAELAAAPAGEGAR